MRWTTLHYLLRWTILNKIMIKQIRKKRKMKMMMRTPVKMKTVLKERTGKRHQKIVVIVWTLEMLTFILRRGSRLDAELFKRSWKREILQWGLLYFWRCSHATQTWWMILLETICVRKWLKHHPKNNWRWSSRKQRKMLYRSVAILMARELSKSWLSSLKINSAFSS